MDINYRAHFDATPDQVVAMMTDPAWWQDVHRRGGGTTSNAVVTDDSLSLDVAMPAPSQVAKFVGPTLTAKQTLSWQPAGPDNSREGVLQIVPHGMPAQADGHARVRADATGTEVVYTGTFTVSVPLVGKKLEKTAGPHIIQAFEMQQDAGNDWLASH
ncbi:DUF2505 domain-containing protein [Cutibacterium sp. WCA-380-WT-3A]|uniref:DUF2505 domain-containing protein n=1 Tax=Cutibacterium porci TaxID=2605781 RepID=A0A7K0J5Z4_9ACTN|nr:DUF2505 domain-containing protein [Cutibacterium porci]MSS45364.1 DUF2505 domain-containing protein [Cutibacterium porci]